MTKELISSLSANGRNTTGNVMGKSIMCHIWGFDWEKEKVWIQMYSIDLKECLSRNWSFEDGIPQGGIMLREHARTLFPILFPAFNWLKVEIFVHGSNMPPEMMKK